MIQFLLSNRQRKELLVRNRSLQLALPAPPDAPSDALAWARSVLPGDVSQLARAAREEELVVVVPRERGETLTGVIGRILTDDDLRAAHPGELVLCIAAIVVDLVPADRRHDTRPPQWPTDCLIEGKPLLKRHVQ